MNRRVWLTGAAALELSTSARAQPGTPRRMASDTLPRPPSPRREGRTLVQLGRTRTDDYAWMKDEDWQKVLRDPSVLKPEIRAHLEAENAFSMSEPETK